jgi:hypothetical protein
MYFPLNWNFGSALSKLQNFGVEPLKPPSVRHWLPKESEDRKPVKGIKPRYYYYYYYCYYDMMIYVSRM